MRILITGAGGMLGRDVDLAAAAAGHETVTLARAELDIADRAAVELAVGAVRPDVVVNCAAWTDVDGAEEARASAQAVNAAGAGNVAAAATAAGAWTLHVSSDYVFDGRKRSPYLESDPTGPISVYGETKLEGERDVARAAPARHTIVRSSLAVRRGRPLLSEDDPRARGPALSARGRRRPGRLPYVHRPSGGRAGRAGRNPDRGAGPRGRRRRVCSWYEFARAIVEAVGYGTEVTPVGTERFPRPAPRPAYSVLRSERGAPGLPHWTEGLARFIELTSAREAA